jgi:hypothetical protein
MTNRDEFLKRARDHFAKQLQKVADTRKRKLMEKRFELVSFGLESLEKKQIPAAATHFRAFLYLLEESKEVKAGELTPALFDMKADIGEILLLLAVYWEMIKIYDHLKSDDGVATFNDYLNKYILFAKGSPMQAVSAEAVRRYLLGGRPVHAEEFRKAYDQLGKKPCFVVTSLWDVTQPETLPALRGFRDERLARTRTGRMMIRGYYVCGPYLADAMDRMPQGLRRLAGMAADRVAKLV